MNTDTNAKGEGPYRVDEAGAMGWFVVDDANAMQASFPNEYDANTACKLVNAALADLRAKCEGAIAAMERAASFLSTIYGGRDELVGELRTALAKLKGESNG